MGILRGVLRDLLRDLLRDMLRDPIQSWAMGPFALFLLVGVALCVGCGSTPKATTRIVEGESAGVVTIELPTLDGRIIRSGDYRPQAVLVTYFATWCTPCFDDLLALDRLDRALDDLTVIAVSIDPEPKLLLPSFFEVVPVTFPVVLADAATLDAKTPFGHLAAIPASYLLDGDGKHVQTFLGPTPIDYLHRRVMALAEETR